MFIKLNLQVYCVIIQKKQLSNVKFIFNGDFINAPIVMPNG